MTKRFVIVHEIDGIFVGHAMGHAFYSNIDCVGQCCVATFESEEQCATFISDTGDFPMDMFKVIPVEVSDKDPTYAHPDELDAAGLGHLTEELRINLATEEAHLQGSV